MEIQGPLIKGRFIERPNRFLTIVKIGNKSVESHLPDPGRLREILTPGRKLYLRKVIESEHRKTEYSTILARYNGELVSLVSALPNQFVKECINSKILSFLKGLELVKPEIVYGNHRFDFLLKDKFGDPFYLEVKSVTYVENGVAEFPDAVTSRGSKHLKTLIDAIKKGYKSYIIFLVQIQRMEYFKIAKDIDKEYYQNYLIAKKAGVNFLAYRCKISPKEIKVEKKIKIIDE